MELSQTRRMRRGAATLVATFLLAHAGCVAPGPEPYQRNRALPLEPQSSERYQCGPSTLASVLAFHGRDVPEAVIASAIYSPTAKGVLLHDMAWFAREQGFQAEVRTGSLHDLEQAVERQQPPIVLLDYGVAHIRRPHFTAITGVTDGGVFQLDDKRSDDYVRIALFTRLWKRAGNQYLVLMPPASPWR